MSFPPVPFLQATGGDSEGWEYGRWQFETDVSELGVISMHLNILSSLFRETGSLFSAQAAPIGWWFS